MKLALTFLLALAAAPFAFGNQFMCSDGTDASLEVIAYIPNGDDITITADDKAELEKAIQPLKEQVEADLKALQDPQRRSLRGERELPWWDCLSHCVADESYPYCSKVIGIFVGSASCRRRDLSTRRNLQDVSEQDVRLLNEDNRRKLVEYNDVCDLAKFDLVQQHFEVQAAAASTDEAIHYLDKLEIHCFLLCPE